MRNTTRFLVTVGVVTLLLAGCGRREAPPTRPGPAPAPAPAPSPVEAPPLSPGDYVATASSIDLLVIEASQLAQTKARGASVRELAAMLIADHSGVSAQLSFAGRRLNLLPSATMMPRHQALLQHLKGSWDFDAGFKRIMIDAHEQGVRVHGDFARAGNSPTLRPVAEIAYPAMRRHLDELRGL